MSPFCRLPWSARALALPVIAFLSGSVSAVASPAASPPAPASVTKLGSPLICFEIDFGEGVNLPLTATNDRAVPVPPQAGLVAAIRAVMTTSNDGFAHMEMVRRTVLHAMALDGEDRTGAAGRALLDAVRTAFTDDLLAALAKPTAGDTSAGRRALRWFDLAYLLAAMHEGGYGGTGGSRDYFEKALELAPDDDAIRLGTGIAAFLPSDAASRADFGRRLAPLFAAGHETAPRVKKNALATIGMFLGNQDWAKLGVEVQKHVGRT